MRVGNQKYINKQRQCEILTRDVVNLSHAGIVFKRQNLKP